MILPIGSCFTQIFKIRIFLPSIYINFETTIKHTKDGEVPSPLPKPMPLATESWGPGGVPFGTAARQARTFSARKEEKGVSSGGEKEREQKGNSRRHVLTVRGVSLSLFIATLRTTQAFPTSIKTIR